MYVMKWWNLGGLITSVIYTKWPSALAYNEMNIEMMKWIVKLFSDQWNDETLEGLSKSVKHTKWPSEFTYDEMNIHVKRVSNYEDKMC